MGQKRKSFPLSGMSGLPPEADITPASPYAASCQQVRRPAHADLRGDLSVGRRVARAARARIVIAQGTGLKGAQLWSGDIAMTPVRLNFRFGSKGEAPGNSLTGPLSALSGSPGRNCRELACLRSCGREAGGLNTLLRNAPTVMSASVQKPRFGSMPTAFRRSAKSKHSS